MPGICGMCYTVSVEKLEEFVGGSLQWDMAYCQWMTLAGGSSPYWVRVPHAESALLTQVILLRMQLAERERPDGE